MSARIETRAPRGLSCLAVLVAVKLGLGTLGFGRFFALAGRLLRARAGADAPAAVLRETVRRVALVAAFFPGRALCLEQSLALWLLLRRRGIEADLRLGVQPYPFGAHAWVEHRGEPVNERPEFVGSFVTLPSFGR